MKINLNTLEQAILADNHLGFCLECGEESDGCEPDAREYKCHSCNEYRVFGAEEILIMGEFE